MLVDAENCRTVDEELEYIEKQFDCIGNFFTCDVHPNQVRAYEASFKRLWRKRSEVKRTEE